MGGTAMHKGIQYIGRKQFALLLVLSNLFSYLTYYPRATAGQVEFGSSIAGLVLGNLAVWGIGALFFALEDGTGKNLCDFMLLYNRPLGRLYNGLLAAFLGLAAAHSICGFVRFLNREIFPQSSYLVFLLPFLGVLIFGVVVGIESFARTASVIFVCAALSVALIFFGTVGNVEPSALRAYSQVRWNGLWGTFVAVLQSNVELLLLFTLVKPLAQRTPSVFQGYFWLATGGSVGLSLLVNLALGNYAQTQQYPFYALAVSSDLSVVQRLDSFYLVIWVLISFARVTALLLALCTALQGVLPDRRYNSGAWTALALVAALSVAVGASNRLYEWLTAVVKGCFAPLTLALLPLLYVLYKRAANGGEKRRGGARGEAVH